MESKCKELNIREEIIDRSKSMAIEYFKKTCHKPHYSSASHVIPAIVYIVCILEGDKRFKTDIAKTFGISSVTIRKWQVDVMGIMNIKELETDRKVKKMEIDLADQFCEIDKEGEILSLNFDTIEMAKHLMSKYFTIESFEHHYPHIRRLRSALIYTASIIENDRRRQMEICRLSEVSEAVISYRYHNIIRILGLKIICHQGHTITALEDQYDS